MEINFKNLYYETNDFSKDFSGKNLVEGVEFKVDEEAAKKWLANGAQPTEVVGKIFKLAGITK